MNRNVKALERAIDEAGSQAALAKALGVTQQAISKWLRHPKGVPSDQAPKIEAATGIRREQLRPDVFGA